MLQNTKSLSSGVGVRQFSCLRAMYLLFHKRKENYLELLLVKFVKIKSSESSTDETDEIKAQMLNDFPAVTALGRACLSQTLRTLCSSPCTRWLLGYNSPLRGLRCHFQSWVLWCYGRQHGLEPASVAGLAQIWIPGLQFMSSSVTSGESLNLSHLKINFLCFEAS